MHACGSPPAGGGVVGGGVVGGGVLGDAAGGVAGAAGAAGGGAELSSLELLELSELVELFFAGSFVVAALPPLSLGSVPSVELEGTVGAEQPASAATPMLESASSERATSWVAAFICQILWLRSRCSVTT